MFACGSGEINAFKDLCEAADRQPMVVASALHVSTMTADRAGQAGEFRAGPNPAGEHVVVTGIEDINEVCFYDLVGRRYPASITTANDNVCIIGTPALKGVAILVCRTASGRTVSFKLVLH